MLIKFSPDVERKFGGTAIIGPFTVAYNELTCDGIEVMERLHPDVVSQEHIKRIANEIEGQVEFFNKKLFQ